MIQLFKKKILLENLNCKLFSAKIIVCYKEQCLHSKLLKFNNFQQSIEIKYKLNLRTSFFTILNNIQIIV